MNRNIRRRLAVGMSAAALVFAGAACDDEDQASVESDVEEALDDAEEAVRTAVSEAEEAIGEAASDAAELAVRNIATQQGEEQFADADHPLDENGLDCTATVDDGLDSVAVTCTGSTEDGSAAELTGATSELPGASVSELEGDFVGTVDGEEVFTTDRLGG